MRLGTIFAAVAFCAVPAAYAAVTVIGNGLAHACYIAAEHDYGRSIGEETCTTALENDPLTPRDRAATYVNRGVVRAGMRHFEAALADYEQAIAFGRYLSSPDLGVAYVDRASILSVTGRYREAIESANKGLSLGTFQPEIAYYVRAVAEEGTGDLKAAYLDYRQALTIQPSFALAARQLQRFHVETRPADGS
jgi:tetratricopeptide (TPR) repeat protein